ncbi:hypothetical protein, partial [Bacteroides finegoldii]|uniref:hypothetical protein n=1 Tax=Bacteroides finegoldii TaxID=338188 RepID=UPI0032EC3842
IYYISIDGSILILYYLYCLSIFQRTCASFSKAGAKVKGFILTAKLFGSFFHFSFSVRFSGSLSERERRDENDKRKTASLCESDCKYKNFIYYNPNFSGSFFVLKVKRSYALSLGQFCKAVLSWKAGAKVRPFGIQSKYIKLFFRSFFERIC